jgi:hypothetical protein
MRGTPVGNTLLDNEADDVEDEPDVVVEDVLETVVIAAVVMLVIRYWFTPISPTSTTKRTVEMPICFDSLIDYNLYTFCKT